MHLAHDVRQHFEIVLLQAMSNKKLKTEDGSNPLDLNFFLKDCLEYYRPEEYQLVDGERVVRAVKTPASKA